MGSQRRIILGAFLCVAGGIVSPGVHAQSLDCKKAASEIEKAICNDEAVREFDQQLADAIKNRLSEHPGWKGKIFLSQRHWLQYRDSQCEGFVRDPGKMDDCLRATYAARLSIIESPHPFAEPPARNADAAAAIKPPSPGYICWIDRVERTAKGVIVHFSKQTQLLAVVKRNSGATSFFSVSGDRARLENSKGVPTRYEPLLLRPGETASLMQMPEDTCDVRAGRKGKTLGVFAGAFFGPPASGPSSVTSSEFIAAQ